MLNWLISICIFVVIYFGIIYMYFSEKYNYWKRLGVPQKGSGFSTDLQIYRRKLTLFDVAMRQYHLSNDRYCGIYFAAQPILIIRDPRLLRRLLGKEHEYFHDHQTSLPDGAEPLRSRSLFALKGQSWREMRTTMNAFFTSDKIKNMYILMEECSHQFVKHLSELKETDLDSLEMRNKFSKCTNDIIASLIFGTKSDSLTDKSDEFYKMNDKTRRVGGLYTLKVFIGRLFPFIYRVLNVSVLPIDSNRYFSKMLKDVVSFRQNDKTIRPDMINNIIRAKKIPLKYKDYDNIGDMGYAAAVEESSYEKNTKAIKPELTDEDITAQLLEFFRHGFHSISLTLSYVAYELALNQEIQEKLRTEINETWNSCEGKFSCEILVKMKYLDMVVSETLRKWPRNQILDRIVTKPFTIEASNQKEVPLQLNTGLPIYIPVKALHHDPKYHPKPRVFDPDRFSETNRSKIQPGTYFPFGIGPRNCLGSRFVLLCIKTVIFYLLRDFEIFATEKTEKYSSRDLFWLKIKKRSKIETSEVK